MEKPIKIFMCCHKPFDTVPPLCVPVQGGRALNKPVEGTVGDDGEGGSISEKNREYCELTVMYHAWKNEDLGGYGFCHYRRFFCFDESVKRPYIVRDRLSERDMRLLGTEERIIRLAEGADIITCRSERTALNVYDYYCASPHQFREDIDAFIRILQEKYPQLKEHCKQYMAGDRQYFCNMFIMGRELFDEYCTMLFDILEEFDRVKVMHGDFQADRTDGYLAERFFGIYLSYARGRGARVIELPRIDTLCSRKKRILYHLLPPESGLKLAGGSLRPLRRFLRR